MSRYVEAVYLNSGVAPQKLHYIPWGIDPLIFRPDAPPRQLPTSKSFRFLYVGGTILRKGFDRVLNAYLAEFGPHDDVCLVVKDVGTNSFYAPQCMRSQVIAAMRDPANPTIIYLEEEMTAGQLASLYTACHCLASPYRGEGFGLPVLEGLACGLPPIVPSGGPTDDFVDPESGYLLPSTVVPAEGVANLPGPGGELQISIENLRTTMRRVYENGDATRRAGLAGSQRVQRDFTWQVTTQHIVNRLRRNPRPICRSTIAQLQFATRCCNRSLVRAAKTFPLHATWKAHSLLSPIDFIGPFNCLPQLKVNGDRGSV